MNKNIILTEEQLKNFCRKIKNSDKKIRITETQFKKVLSQTFIVEDKNISDDTYIQKKQGDILKKINGVLNGEKGKASQDYLRDKARRTSINPDFNQKERNQTRSQAFSDLSISSNVNNKIKQAALVLRKYVGNNGYFDIERLEKEYPNEFYELMNLKRFIDSQGLTYLYDTSLPKKKNFGLDSSNNYDINALDMNQKNDDISKWNKNGELTDAEAELKMRQSVLNDYLNKVYGTEVKLPKSVFSNGNLKLSEQTLQINFTSAMGCPAWNECIVRYACYARNTEKAHRDVFNSNAQRNLMWEAAHEDDTLIQDIWELLRMYVVDMNKVCSRYRISINKLAKMKFADMPEDLLNCVKENIRISNIRLNENGDFIGQWLLDAMDEIAGDFNIIGVNTSAYTCRLLNFDKIKNIIINASKTSIKGNSVARYFFAVTEEMYDAFDETYSGVNNALVLEDGKIKMNPQALYNPQTMDPNGMFYYKCPCGREIDGKEVKCNQCGVCYTPNAMSKPYYVLVKAHGGSRNEFKGRVANFGISKNYSLQQEPQEYSAVMQEGVKNNITSAIKIVANNGITSMKKHLNELSAL